MSSCPDLDEVLNWGKLTGIVGLLLFLIYFTLTPIGLIMFFQNRKHSYLKVRQFELTLISTIGMSFQFIVPALSNFIGREKFPCDLLLFLILLVIPIGIGPQVVRLVIFANKSTWQDSLKDASMEDFGEKYDVGSFTTEFVSFLKYKTRSLWKSKKNQAQAKVEDLEDFPDETRSLSEGSSISRRAKFFVQSRLYGLLLQFFVVACALALVGAAIRAEDSSFGGKGCFGCELSDDQFVFYVGLAAFLYLLCIALLVSLRKRPDPLGIKKEIAQAVFIAGSLAMVGTLVAAADIGSLREDRVFDLYYFFNLGILVGVYFLVYKPVIESHRINQDREMRRMSMESTLDHALSPDTPLHKAFYAYLATEWSIENALFLNAVEKFRNSDQELTRKALHVYCTFIEPDSMLEVNISHPVRNNIKEEIEPVINTLRGTGTIRLTTRSRPSIAALSIIPVEAVPLISKDIFDEAYAEVYQLLYSDSWFRFKNSKQYAEINKS